MAITIPVPPLPQSLQSLAAVPASAVPAAAANQAVTTLDSFALTMHDSREAEESCNLPLSSAAAILALPFLWWGLRRFGVGRKSVEQKYEAIVGLLLSGREMYGRDIAKEGKINPGSVYILLDRLVGAGLLEIRETDAHRPNRRLYRLAVPPKRLPSWLIEDEVDLPLAAGASSRRFFPLVISVFSSGRIMLRNQSPYGAPVLYSLQHGRGIESAIPRGGSISILCSKALIRSSDGSNYWLCVENGRCRLVEIKRPDGPRRDGSPSR